MPIPEIGRFTLHQNGGYVCRTMFNVQDSNGKNSKSKQTSNQLAPGHYTIDPGDLGVVDGDEVTFYLWVMASTRDQTAQESFIYRTGGGDTAAYTCSLATVDPKLVFNGIVSPTVSQAQLATASAVGNAVCAAVENNKARGVDNPTLLALQSDPLTVLTANGLPQDFFAGAEPSKIAEYVAYLKAQASSELNALQKRQVPRGFFKCWACRIGFGAVLAIVGLVLTAVTAGVGGAVFTAAVNFLVVWGVAMAVAEGVMVGATKVAGGTALASVGALIEFVCEQIPDTC